MGGCCAAEKNTQETNLMANKAEDHQFGNIPIYTVIKFQAITRGYLARRKVKSTYGFEMTHGLMNRGTTHIEMDPEKLEE